VGDPPQLKGPDLLQIQGQAISEWTSEQEAILAQRREALHKEIDKTLAMVNNLRKLKGLDLTSIYGTSKSASDTEKLTAAEKRIAALEKQIERKSDPKARIALRKQLIDICKEQLAAEDDLLAVKQRAIDAAAGELRQLGFEVERNSETNGLYIANMERLNEITAETRGEYGSLEEATAALREGTMELITQVEGWSQTNEGASDTVDKLRDAMQKAKEGILSDIAEIRRAAEDALKEVVSAYDTLSKASALDNLRGGNIGEAFFPSVSTFQSLMSMESKYLNYLHLESGAITMNRAALKKLTAAKVEDLAVTQAMALVDTIELHREDTETLRQMAGATQEATGATWDLVYAKLAQQNLDKDLNDAFLKQINAMRQLSRLTQIGIYLGIDDSSIQNLLSGIFQKVKSLVSDALKEIKAFVEEFINALKQAYKNMLDSQKSGLDDVLKLTMDLIKYEVEQKVERLKEQIRAYKEIVDLKKKELDLSRQQAKYEEGVAERVAGIARLRAEIAQLKLDDSREAAALRAAKEKELADKQKDLADYQDDHAYDAQVKALDEAADAYEKAKQKEIEDLEAAISSAEKVYRLAVARLEEDFWGLYSQVIAWNTEAGSSINKEITEAWKEAAKAVTLYMGYRGAVKAVDLQLKIQTEGIGVVIADALVDAFSGFFTKTYDLFAGFANKLLGVFGVQLPTSASTGTTGGLITPGGALLSVVGNVIGGAINGIVNGVTGFVKSIFGKFPFFHAGGHVGGKVNGRTSDPAEEVVAVLQTDEVVLTKQQQKNLLTQLDFLRELGSNVHAPVSLDAGYAGVLSRLTAGPRPAGGYGDVSNYGSITVSAPIEVIIQHSGAMDDASAARFGKKVAETTVGTICEAFRKKGIHPGVGNAALKP